MFSISKSDFPTILNGTRFRTGLFLKSSIHNNILLITGVLFQNADVRRLAWQVPAVPKIQIWRMAKQQKHGKKAWEKLMFSTDLGSVQILTSFVCTLFIYYILFLSIFLKIQTSSCTSLVQSN